MYVYIRSTVLFLIVIKEMRYLFLDRVLKTNTSPIISSFMHIKQLQLHIYNTKKPYVHDDDLNLLQPYNTKKPYVHDDDDLNLFQPPHFKMANQRIHRCGGSSCCWFWKKAFS
jgi:hypothetical protein